MNISQQTEDYIKHHKIDIINDNHKLLINLWIDSNFNLQDFLRLVAINFEVL